MKIKASRNYLAPKRIPLTVNTSSYENHFDSLYFSFFSHTQDYESLLMLRREPLMVLSINETQETCAALQVENGKKVSPLLDAHNNSVTDLMVKKSHVLVPETLEILENCRSVI
jgi:hypothetical protein